MSHSYVRGIRVFACILILLLMYRMDDEFNYWSVVVTDMVWSHDCNSSHIVRVSHGIV